jgi:tetratricopeptide (TPR) repeat protein
MRRGLVSAHRTVNLKVVIILVVSLAVCGVSVHFLHGYQVKRNADTLRHRAELAEQKGDLKEAARYYANYLSLTPTDAEARLCYAQVRYRQAKASGARKDQEQAYLLLGEVVRQAPQCHDLRRELAALGLQFRRYPDARDNLTELLTSASPNDPELERDLGLAYHGLGQYRTAANAWVNAITHAPQDLQSYIWLANVLRLHPADVLLSSPRGAYKPGAVVQAEVSEVSRRLAIHEATLSGQISLAPDTSVLLALPWAMLYRGHLDPADAVMEAMVAANSQSAEAHLVRYYHRRQFRVPGAASDVARALALAPDDLAVLVAAAEAARDREPPDLAAARKYLQRALELYPKERSLYQRLASVEVADNQFPRAVEVLGRGLKALPEKEHAELQAVLVELLIDANKVAEAEKVLAGLRKSNLRPASLAYLEARERMQKQDWGGAAQTLEHIRGEAGSDPQLALQVNLALGVCYRFLGNPEQELAAYRQAVGVNPLSAHAHAGLAAALLNAGKYADAIKEYQLAGGLPNSRVNLARALILWNLRQPPSEEQAAFNWAQAEKFLREAQKESPQAVEPALLLAEVHAAKKDFAAAQKALDAVAAANPKSAELWEARVALAQRQHGPEQGRRILEEAARELGDSPDLQLLRVNYWARRGGPEALKALDRLAEGAAALPAPDRLRLQNALAAAYAGLGESSKAVRLWREIAQAHPMDLGSRIYLFDQAVRSGDPATLERLVGEIKHIEGPNGALWRLAEAARLVTLSHQEMREQGRLSDRNRLPEARRLLEDVATRRPNWSRVFFLEGEIALLENNKHQAIDNYQKAFDMGERGVEVVRPLVQLLYRAGKFAQAEKVLQQLQGDPARLSAPERRLRAELDLQRGDIDAAVEQARKTAEASRDFRDHIWLGMICWSAGKNAEAEVALRKALDMAQKSPDLDDKQSTEPYVALVAFLARNNRKPDAKKVVEQMTAQIRRPLTREALAQCQQLLQENDQAEKAFLELVKEKPDDVAARRNLASFYLSINEAAKAEPHLRQLLQLDRATPEDKIWARRHLAVALAVGITLARYNEAVALLGQNLKEDPDSLDDRRARAAVLAAWPGQRRAAMRLLEEIDRKQALRGGDLFLLAQLYESAGNVARAGVLLQRLVDGEGRDNPGHLASYANNLIRDDNLAEAEKVLGRLKQIEPEGLRAAAVEARLLKARGKAHEAMAQLRKFTEGKEAAWIGLAAGVAEEIDPPAAEEFFQKYVKASGRDDSVPALVAYLARRNRLSEALDHCEPLWGKLPPDTVAAAAVAALQAGAATAKDCQRVAAWITAAKPQTPALRFYLASVRNIEGRPDEAYQIYLDLLKEMPTNTSVLNNLAWLEAMHQGMYAEALRHIDEAIKIAGPLPGLLDTRSAIHLKMKNADRAAQDVRTNLDEAPNAIRHFRMAQVHLLNGQQGNALSEWQKARKAGLTRAHLDRLERPMYDQLAEKFPLP